MLGPVSLLGFRLFLQKSSLWAFPGIWAWFHRLLEAKTNKLQTDKGSLRSQDMGSYRREAWQEEGNVSHGAAWSLGPPPSATACTEPPPRGSPWGFQALLPAEVWILSCVQNSCSLWVTWCLVFFPTVQESVVGEAGSGGNGSSGNPSPRSVLLTKWVCVGVS